MVLTPLLGAVGGLLVIAGALKLRAREWSGAAEVVLGGLAVAWPRPLVAALVAVAFAGFAAHSLRLYVASGGEADCGCFGDVEAPAGMSHFVLNVACAVVAGAAALVPPPSLASVVADSPAVGVVLVAGVAGAAYAIFLAYTALPGAWNSFQPGLRGS
jgi:hypothetical protein